MHDWSPGHVHKPEYRVWEDDEDEAVAVRACSFEEAATRYAELDCESDPENTYAYVEHGPLHVVVCNAEGLRKVFKVGGEYEVTFSAREVTP